jgi:NADPH:quinone reductase
MREDLMPAIVVRETGDKGAWNELVLNEAPRPRPKRGEVLVQVEACSVNRADLLQRRGFYPPPPGASSIMGLDFAGSIVDMAEGVEGWSRGDRVFGIVAGGGYGRYVPVHSKHLVEIPDRLNFVEAAAAAEVFFTAFLNLFLEGHLRSGETLLLHGGGSGVGTAAIQLAKSAGITVIITAGSNDKIQRSLDLGASYGINYKEEDFAARALEITQGKGVDVILDWIGASYLEKHLELLKTRGRLVLIGLMGGSKTEINLPHLLNKRLRIIGSVLRSQSLEEKAALVQAFREKVIPLFESGEVRPVVDRVYSVGDVEEAHQFMKEGGHFGKIVLIWQ